MRISWDPRKSVANLAARGFDFAYAALIFDGPTLEKPDTRRDYGEARVVAVGIADGFLLTVVYTDRSSPDGLERRLISARRSNRRERKAYQTRPQS
ncbi:MAG: BrnT family toxin [bacterium]